MDPSILSFYVTVGRGTESFAKREIRNKFSEQAATDSDFTQVRDGKVIFTIPDGCDEYLNKVLSLKSVERAFVAITDYENTTKGKREFLDQLMQTMSSSLSFGSAVKVLNQLALLSRCTQIKNTNALSTTDDVDEPMKKKAKLHNAASENCSKLTLESELVCSNVCDEVDDIKHDKAESFGETSCYKTFRMSTKCSGKSRKWINVKKLSKDLSWRVSRASGWTVDLRNPDFEICLHINDLHVTAGIPLTVKPLSRRPYISDPGLRGPVAWIMGQLLAVKPGDVILDPMCGKGTLLLEMCSDIKDVCYIGVDIDSSQIDTAQQNITRIGYQKHVDLLQGDGLGLPVKASSVDGVLCDAPFNRKHFTSKRPDQFYVAFLEEMYRVLRIGGRFVLLTSQDFSRMVIPLLEASQSQDQTDCTAGGREPSDSEDPSVDSSFIEEYNLDKKFAFQLLSTHYMKLGETHGEIIVMVKL